MRIEPLLSEDRVVLIEGASDPARVLRRVAEVAAAGVDSRSAGELEEALLERERRYPTSTPDGVAFPHAMLEGVASTVLVVAGVRPAVKFRDAGEVPPIDLVFGMIGSSAEPFQHVRLLARLARICRGPGALDRLRTAGDARALYEAVLTEDRAHG
jgi:nitrogen PTS system EIIA component